MSHLHTCGPTGDFMLLSVQMKPSTESLLEMSVHMQSQLLEHFGFWVFTLREWLSLSHA